MDMLTSFLIFNLLSTFSSVNKKLPTNLKSQWDMVEKQQQINSKINFCCRTTRQMTSITKRLFNQTRYDLCFKFCRWILKYQGHFKWCVHAIKKAFWPYRGIILPDYDILVDCTFGNGLEQRIFAALFFFTMYIFIQYYVIATNGRALIEIVLLYRIVVFW